MCCLLGVKRDVAESVLQIVRSTDYCSLLLFHVSTNDTTSWNLVRINGNYKALGRQVKNIGAQVIISFILSVGGNWGTRNKHIIHINSWIQDRCCWEGYGFYDNGTFFYNCNLLGRDGNHLSRRYKQIFGSRLANLVRQALNWRAQKAESKVATFMESHPLVNKLGQLEQWQIFLSCLPRWEPECRPPPGCIWNISEVELTPSIFHGFLVPSSSWKKLKSWISKWDKLGLLFLSSAETQKVEGCSRNLQHRDILNSVPGFCQIN